MKTHPLHRITVWVGVALLLVWSLGPIYWTLVSSITPSGDFSDRPIHFFPIHFTLDHFERLLGINVDRIGGVEVWAQFRSALFNSVVTSLSATIVCVAISALGVTPLPGSNFRAGVRCSWPSSQRSPFPAMRC